MKRLWLVGSPVREHTPCYFYSFKRNMAASTWEIFEVMLLQTWRVGDWGCLPSLLSIRLWRHFPKRTIWIPIFIKGSCSSLADRQLNIVGFLFTPAEDSHLVYSSKYCVLPTAEIGSWQFAVDCVNLVMSPSSICQSGYINLSIWLHPLPQHFFHAATAQRCAAPRHTKHSREATFRLWDFFIWSHILGSIAVKGNLAGPNILSTTLLRLACKGVVFNCITV